jgi:hypothetical protein
MYRVAPVNVAKLPGRPILIQVLVEYNIFWVAPGHFLGQSNSTQARSAHLLGHQTYCL